MAFVINVSIACSDNLASCRCAEHSTPRLDRLRVLAPPRPSRQLRNLHLAKGLFWPKEHPMADNKKPDAKQPGEPPEGEYHYHPGNQWGKAPKIVPKKEPNENDEPHHERSK